MKEFTYKITDENGIHARPAGLFVKAAAGFPCSVTIRCGDVEKDAKRIMGVMGMGVKQGQEVVVKCDGEQEEEAAAALEAFLKENL